MVYDLQRASMWKRISAWLLDTILLVIMVTGFLWIISSITHYDKYTSEYTGYIKSYESKYNTSFDYTKEQYEALSQADRDRYDEAVEAFNSDKSVSYTNEMIVNLTLLLVTLSILFSYIILEIIIPIFLKNGQTIGKKVFALGVMRTDCVKLTNFQLVVRTLLGKYTIETMIPILLIIMLSFGFIGAVGIIVIFAILAFNVGLMIATRTNSCIHDVFAVTVVVDLPSQMIFDSPEALIHYKEEHAADAASRATY